MTTDADSSPYSVKLDRIVAHGPGGERYDWVLKYENGEDKVEQWFTDENKAKAQKVFIDKILKKVENDVNYSCLKMIAVCSIVFFFIGAGTATFLKTILMRFFL